METYLPFRMRANSPWSRGKRPDGERPPTSLRPGRSAARCAAAIGALLCAAPIVSGLSAFPAAAESRTTMWGVQTGTGGASRVSPRDSAEMHMAYGIVAGQVNAARDGLLYQGTSISITAVGSQNIVSTTIQGDGNTVQVDAKQDSANSGDVTNNGTINVQKGALVP